MKKKGKCPRGESCPYNQKTKAKQRENMMKNMMMGMMGMMGMMNMMSMMGGGNGNKAMMDMMGMMGNGNKGDDDECWDMKKKRSLPARRKLQVLQESHCEIV